MESKGRRRVSERTLDQRLVAFVESQQETIGEAPAPDFASLENEESSAQQKPRLAENPLVRATPDRYREVEGGRWVDMKFQNGAEKVLLLPTVKKAGEAPQMQPPPSAFPWETKQHAALGSIAENASGQDWKPANIGLLAQERKRSTASKRASWKHNSKSNSTNSQIKQQSTWYQGRERKGSSKGFKKK